VLRGESRSVASAEDCSPPGTQGPRGMGERRFVVDLIKRSHYDDDG
jgi:hypothetical protein